MLKKRHAPNLIEPVGLPKNKQNLLWYNNSRLAIVYESSEISVTN
jgi:hypothetical protein